MKKTLSYLVASLVVVFVAMPAFAGIEWSGNIAVGIEKTKYGVDKIEVPWTYRDETGTTTGTSTEYAQDKLQFTDAKVNLDAKVEIADGVTVVAQIRQEWGLETRKVAVELSNLIPNATLMVGKVVFPMGKEADSQTEGANMMKNVMIGDSALFDIELTGQIVDYGMALKTAMGAVNCLLAITNGNYGDSSDNNSKKAIGLRLDGDVKAVPGLSLAASYGIHDATPSNSNETDKATGMVIDAGYVMDAFTLGVAYGDSELKEGAAKIKVGGLSIEAIYAISDACSLAVRRSTVKADETDNFEVTKLQAGVNYKLADNTLFKLEYVDNKVDDKPNVKDFNDYKGIKAAVAVAF